MSGNDDEVLGPSEDRPTRGGYRGTRETVKLDAEKSQAQRKTRRSRLGSTQDESDFPEKYRDPEMSYQWWAVKILNQEVDNSRYVDYADGSWEPVRPNEMPGVMPESYKGNTIDRKGLRLYKRPKYLTEEAHAEDQYIANEQKRAKLAQAMSTPGDSAPRKGTQLDLSVGPGVKS